MIVGEIQSCGRILKSIVQLETRDHRFEDDSDGFIVTGQSLQFECKKERRRKR